MPLCSSGRTARTVTVPPVTGVLIRARNVPDTLPANHSVVAFAGTVIVVNGVQVAPKLDEPVGVIGAFPDNTQLSPLRLKLNRCL
jgi:hypothetical protein